MDISDFLQAIFDNVDVDDISDAYSHARKVQKISQAISKRYEAKDINRALAKFAQKYDYGETTRFLVRRDSQLIGIQCGSTSRRGRKRT